ncbi:hypothetical protein P7C73_g5169, partial [Tremellales sp. Uapishka_1]
MVLQTPEENIQDVLNEEPPPAYTPVANPSQHEVTVSAGPSRMDFSGPPPAPDRQAVQQQNNGWGAVQNHNMGSAHSVTPQHTGQYVPPALPPRHPSAQQQSHFQPPQAAFSTTIQSSPYQSHPPPPSKVQPSPPTDLTPTTSPTPGRPLLFRNQLLDWKKYGRAYTSAIQHSYLQSTSRHANASTSSSENYQKPLPNFAPRQPPLQPQPQPQHNPYAHLPPPPQHNPYAHLPPSPQPLQPGQQVFVGAAVRAPPGALVVQPGDPRIGGRGLGRLF